MIPSDKDILKFYKLGWHECFDNKPKKENYFTDKILYMAYLTGWDDYIIGDDVSSVDYQTEEEILTKIKNCKKQMDVNVIEEEVKPEVIKSISYNQHDIINNIIKLHCPDGIEVDTTYSKGVFYKKSAVPQPKYKFDKYPQTEDTIQLEDKLPFDDNTIGSIMFDPPFVISKGPSMTAGIDGQNIISKRFSSYESPVELFKSYEEHLTEYYRVLKPGGVLIFKTQDTVSGGKNYFTHVWVMNKAYEIGFYPKDLSILLAKSRIISGKHKNQQHNRKFHSYFWVFTKEKSKVNYNTL